MKTEVEIKIFVIQGHEKTFTEPKRATKNSACYDLYTNFGENKTIMFFDKPDQAEQKEINFCKKQSKKYIILNPGERVVIPTGIIFDIPSGYSIRIHPRSGYALKAGLTLPNSMGVIDEDYIDPTGILLYNMGNSSVRIYDNERTCQMEIYKDVKSKLTITKTKPEIKSERRGGFGHTGRS